MNKFVKILIGLITLTIVLMACSPAAEAPAEVEEPEMIEEEEVVVAKEVEVIEEEEEVAEVEEPSEVDAAGYTKITVDSLKTMLDERPESFTLVNTFISFEENIPNTDLKIPAGEILENLDKLPQDKVAEIVLYCWGGKMSSAASTDLVQAGYTNVKTVIGGLNTWDLVGYPLDVDAAGYTKISVDTLKTMLDERPDSFTLVNTFISFEKNIPNTDLKIPGDEILENLDKLPQDKDAEIVLYCWGGKMSKAASADLVQAGYTNVKTVIGGLNNWDLVGYPLDTEP